MDRISPELRRKNMQAVKSKNTAPEIEVRKSLFAMGYRYQLHRSNLPGRPDVVIAGRKAAIFVHGCFWHQHARCSKARAPETNKEFWDRKLANNRLRDQRNMQELDALGWRSLVIWECESRDSSRVTRLLTEFLATFDSSSAARCRPNGLRIMSWPISNHESPDVDLTIPRATAPHYLWAMLSADGENFREGNYETVREYLRRAVSDFADRSTGGQTPRAEVADSRLRTWKTAFEDMGLLTVDENGHIRATRFGRAVVDGLEASADSVQRANRRIAELGAHVANRVLLAKPDRDGRPPVGMPADSDLLPLRAIWRAFRRLGDRLHWQDINRVLGHVHYERDVDAAIDQIARFRAAHPTGYADPALCMVLGPHELTNDPRHITPWFNRAGLGGMLIPSNPDNEGFRSLPRSSATVVDGLLGNAVPAPPPEARTNRDAYITYLMAPVEIASRPKVSRRDAALVDRVIAAVREFGKSSIYCARGIAWNGQEPSREDRCRPTNRWRSTPPEGYPIS